MKATSLPVRASLLACLAAIAMPAPVTALTDFKTMTPAACSPYGPGTTASELVFNQLGVSNPGTVNESVICSLRTDGEDEWSTEPGASADLYVFFRAGAVPGKVACTAFVSNATMDATAIYTTSANPANVAANTRSTLHLWLADTTGTWGVAAPAAVVCTLTPKAILGGFNLVEQVPTHIP